jgi:hypothetical protein
MAKSCAEPTSAHELVPLSDDNDLGRIAHYA